MSEVDYPARMSDADALLWEIEDDPMLRSIVVSVTTFDEMPDRTIFLQTIERMTRAVPRFRQRVVPDPLGIAPPRWELDPNFNLDYHVRWVKAPRGGDTETLLAMAAPIGMQAFDSARPLWELTVVEGLTGGRAAMITKMHHSITDGVGGVEMAMNLYDFEPGAPARAMPPLPIDTFQYNNRLLDAGRHELRRGLSVAAAATATSARSLFGLVRDPVGSARTVVATAASARRTLGPSGRALSDVMARRSLSTRYAVITVPLSALKSAARAVDAKVNDVFVAAIAEGVAAYHHKQRSEVSELRMAMMVNVRSENSGPVGNEFTAVKMALPIAERPRAQRITEVQALVSRTLAEPALHLTRPLMSVVRRFPRPLVVKVVGDIQRGFDVISSNIPGPPIPVYLAGVRLNQIIPLGPLTGAAVNVTMMSYGDDVTIGITMDLAAVTDPDVLIDCLRAAFEQ